MKKIASVLIVGALMATSANSTFAQSDPFSNLKETTVVTKDNAKVENATTDFKVEKVGEDQVKVMISLDNEGVQTKSAKFVVKFPDVVTIESTDVVKGALYDTNTVDIKDNTLTYTAEAVTSIPAKGELFTATFKVKPGTVKQEYPFTIDELTSNIVNELNEEITVKTGGVEMVELSTFVEPVKEEVKKETGFAENAAVLALLGLTSMSYLASRRKKSV